MKKWGLIVMLVAMLAAPMLACGFPLPAGTEMMTVSKAVCGKDEAPDTCQERQDAYQLMSKVQSAIVPDLAMNLVLDSGDPTQDMSITVMGSYEFMLVESSEGLGASVHGVLEQGQLVNSEGTQDLSGTEFIIIGSKGYTTRDGGVTWVEEDLTEDSISGLGMFLGLGGTAGSGFDLYTDPETFTVTVGADEEYDGKTMHVHTLALDLMGLFSATEALSGLMDSGLDAGGDSLGVSEESLGMSSEEFAMMAGMLLPFLNGTEISTTLHIGADDGYIYYVSDDITFMMDLSVMDPEQAPVTMVYQLSGHVTGHNQPLEITAPEGATTGEGGLFGGEGGLFGSETGIGDSLFGGE
ncbi:MAG: hypothetical protein JW966_14655 [Anaerolineae bacterium]|nr:hypothetical protein [Anaerolineae bacterium]